jgi:hypothetical protein
MKMDEQWQFGVEVEGLAVGPFISSISEVAFVATGGLLPVQLTFILRDTESPLDNPFFRWFTGQEERVVTITRYNRGGRPTNRTILRGVRVSAIAVSPFADGASAEHPRLTATLTVAGVQFAKVAA